MNFNDLAGMIKNIHFSLYGEGLIGVLAFLLSGTPFRILGVYKQFYQGYLNIWQTVFAKLEEASLSLELDCEASL